MTASQCKNAGAALTALLSEGLVPEISVTEDDTILFEVPLRHPSKEAVFEFFVGSTVLLRKSESGKSVATLKPHQIKAEIMNLRKWAASEWQA